VDEEYLRRTVIFPLHSMSSSATALCRELITSEFQRACNIAVDYGWEHHITNKQQLATEIKEKVAAETKLKSQHCTLACYQAAEALSGASELWDKPDHDVSKPEFTAEYAVFDKNTMTLFEEEREVSLTMHGNASRVRASLPVEATADGHQWQYVTDDKWQIAESTVHERDGEFYLHLGVKRPAPEKQATVGSGTVLGVDLNVTGPFATTSTGEFIGSADELIHHRTEYERRRAALQQTGTRSAHLTLKGIGSRFANWSAEWLHCRANDLIDAAHDADADGIVFEDLTDIRDRMRNDTKFQQWAFAYFQQIVKYKARADGLWVDTVPAAYTSKECSRCGYVSDANRSGDEFSCIRCKREVHSDYDGAVMVAKKYLRLQKALRAGQTCQRGGAECHPALKSGTLQADASAVTAMQRGANTDKPYASTSEGTQTEAK